MSSDSISSEDSPKKQDGDNSKQPFASKFSFNLFSNNKNDDDKSNRKLLEDKIFNQQDVNSKAEQEKDSVEDAKRLLNEEKKQSKKINIWDSVSKILMGEKDVDLDTLFDIVSSAIATQDAEQGELSDTKSAYSAEDFKVVIQKVYHQMKGNFKDVPVDKIDPLAFLYYLEGEDSRKNPSWRRRLHRFMPPINMDTLHGFQDALYLAQLGYADTVEEVGDGLEKYQGAKYEPVFCTTEGMPGQPAHFIVIKKEGVVPVTDPSSNSSNSDHSKPSIFPFARKTTYLEIVFVVRGTKTLEDMFSDAMLESSPYRDGLAHDGVCLSGKYLVEKQTDLLLRVLKMSGRDKIRLTLIGHSLGAGAAAIACMEFNEYDEIEATCIGFGCPALVNKEMSLEWKDKITTVVSDSDCVVRMSGATAANLLMDLCEFNYKDYAMQDVSQFVGMISENASYLLPSEKKEEVMNWFSEQLDRNCKPLSGLERRDVVLFPPGKCVHFYRDGVGISAVEVPCTLFNEFDVTRTMVDDHLVPTGYGPLLLETMRSHAKDPNFQFSNDVIALFKAMKMKDEDESGN